MKTKQLLTSFFAMLLLALSFSISLSSVSPDTEICFGGYAPGWPTAAVLLDDGGFHGAV